MNINSQLFVLSRCGPWLHAQDLLDDATLLGTGVGMSKFDVRRLRHALAKRIDAQGGGQSAGSEKTKDNFGTRV